MTRQTVRISQLKLRLNKLLAESKESQSFRLGAIDLAEDIFIESGKYHGFCLLSQGEVPDDEEPGIRGEVVVDGTRRRYL